MIHLKNPLDLSMGRLRAEEVEGGIPALKKELVEMGGYSQSIVDDLIFQPRPVTAP